MAMQRGVDPAVATGVPIAESGARKRPRDESDGERKEEAHETRTYLRRRTIEDYQLIRVRISLVRSPRRGRTVARIAMAFAYIHMTPPL
eukprot:1513688-Prymnesium_polylepis.1